MNERSHTNSVPWMYAIGPKDLLNWMKVTWQTQQTACIHGTELVRPLPFMVRSWCDCVHSWYEVYVTARPRAFMVQSWWDLACCWCDSAKSLHVFCVHCTVYTAKFGRFFTECKEIHQIPYIPWLMTCKTGDTLSKSTIVTLRSWCDLVKRPYGVKKIRIKWFV